MAVLTFTVQSDDSALQLDDASSLPAAGLQATDDFVVAVDSEHILVRRRTGNQLWDCVRGVDNTAPARHLAGATVSFVEPPAPGLGVGSILPWINVKNAPYSATGNSTTDDTAAIQAAINATDANRGGIVFLPQGRYRIATGLTVTNQGTILMGEGMPGNNRAAGQGSTRIIPDNGLTGITFNPGGTHFTLGYGMSNLHVVPASGATTGHGVVVRNAERFTARDVTISDFIGGTALAIDGLAGNSQYADLLNVSCGDSLTGLHLKGTGPNGVRLYGGVFVGQGVTPRAASRGIYVETGDTVRLFGTVLQGWATGVDVVSPAAGAEMYGLRLEYCNLGLHFGSTVQKARVYGGGISNALLGNPGSGNVGVKIDSGATDVEVDFNYIVGTSTEVDDRGLARTLKQLRTRSYTTATRPTASVMGAGFQLFDLTLNKPVWSDGTNWRDAAGSVV